MKNKDIIQMLLKYDSNPVVKNDGVNTIYEILDGEFGIVYNPVLLAGGFKGKPSLITNKPDVYGRTLLYKWDKELQKYSDSSRA